MSNWWDVDPTIDPTTGKPPAEPAKPKAEPWMDKDPEVKGGRSLFGPDRYQLWPERMARQMIKEGTEFVTAPGEAYRGQLDPLSQEAANRMGAGAFLMSPTNPAYRAGSRFGAPPRPAQTDAEIAAATSRSLGAPLPGGYTHEGFRLNPFSMRKTGETTIRNTTQAVRALPFAGSLIDRPVLATRQAAGEAVGRIAGELGEAGRFQLGGNMRGEMDNIIATNQQAMNDAYGEVRRLIDPDATFVPRHTQAVYEKVLRERMAARQVDPMAGLGQVDNMVNQGISFNGLVTAKNDLAQGTAFGEVASLSGAHKKMLGAAMKRDLHEHVTHAVHPSIGRDQALTAMRNAETTASQLINQNQRLRNLTSKSTDESLAAQLIGAGREKTGDVQLLHQLRASMPADRFNQIAGATLHELGYNTNLGQFSLDQFARQWGEMSTAGKAALFSPQHRRFLDDIATLGQHIKRAELNMNRSQTGRTTGLLGLIAGIGGAGHALWTGDVSALMGLGASAAAGYTLAGALARPEIAASAARFARAAIRYDQHPNAATLGALRLATTDTIRMMREDKTLSFDQMRQMTLPSRSEGGPHYPVPQQREEPLPFDPYRM